ncbi:hypothetical protein ACLBW8_16165 [Pseudomonas sp. M5A4_2d]
MSLHSFPLIQAAITTALNPVTDTPSSDAVGTVSSSAGGIIAAVGIALQVTVAPVSQDVFYKSVIYGAANVSPPTAVYTQAERMQRINDYADRVVASINNIESGSEGERNIKFQQTRQFLEPAGYFSGGLLAAGYDPHEKITVTFNSYVGRGTPDTLTNSTQRTFFAWEIAAGALAHDKVERGGPINFQSMHIEQQDRNKVAQLESMGNNLQRHWENEASEPMRDTAGALAHRSGKADAYGVRGTLQSLANDKDGFERLSHDAQEAVKRTLHRNGQVIIPNIYGYPLAGYAFVPFLPFNGNVERRPDKGVMIDLKNGTVTEIWDESDFAGWAKKNRDHVLRSFNGSDRQGGRDAHWPKAGDVLDNLIAGNHSSYPGYQSLTKDQAVPVWETFNYTQSRDTGYRLKYGNLNSSIAAHFQTLNANNAVWSDQTEVFGSSQQNWKAAKDLWGNTFGYFPVLGNTGNIVFGIHDAIDGMTAADRLGGSAAAVVSALQLAHELAPTLAAAALAEVPRGATSALAKHYTWSPNALESDLELVRAPKASDDSTIVSAANDHEPGNKVPGANDNEPGNKAPSANDKKPDVSGPRQGGHINEQAVPDGEQLIEKATRNAKGIYQVKDANTGVDQWFIRYTDATGVPGVYEIRGDFKLNDEYVQIINRNTGRPIMTVYVDGKGGWGRVALRGGVNSLTDGPPFEPVRLKERIAGSTMQKPATPEQIVELKKRPNGVYTLMTQDSKGAAPYMMDGAYAFVVRADEPNTVYLGSMNGGLTPEGKIYPFNAQTNAEWVEGHSALANGLRSLKGGTTDVLFAGTVYIEKGEPTFWTNSSGHYQPPAELRRTNLTPTVKNLLPEGRFVEEDKLTAAQQKSWHESTHMSHEEQAFNDDYMKEKFGVGSYSDSSDNEISDDD